jgi:uncharacterized membrane protein
MSTPNPYAAPKAPVADATPGLEGNFIPGGRVVAPGRGWSWIAEGWDLFKCQPAMWIALVVIAALIFIAMAFIPVLGSLAAVVLAPVFAGGLVIGCRALDQGGELEIAHLFAGFRERFATLVSVGVIYLVATVVIALVVGLVTGAGMWTLFGGGTADAVSVGAAGLTVLLAFLVMFALMLPVFMAIWFAPPLVVFHDQGAAEAMKASFFACLRNIIPFLIYGVVLFVLAILASIPFGLGWLILGPVMAASLYTAYRDIFFQ